MNNFKTNKTMVFQTLLHKPVHQYGNNNTKRIKKANTSCKTQFLESDLRKSVEKKTNKEKQNTYERNEKEFPKKRICKTFLFKEKSENNKIPKQDGNTSCDSCILHDDIGIEIFQPKVIIRLDEKQDLHQFPNNKGENNTVQMVVEDDDDELRCPNCRITYMNKLSLKNHIQVCGVSDWSQSRSMSLQKDAILCSTKEKMNNKRALMNLFQS